jgi:hypothetical protein
MKKYKCVCCGNFTMNSEKHGSYDICPICFWEDDIVQYDDPNYAGGANEISLVRARENFIRIGSISEKHLSMVREPNAEENAFRNLEES